jgi:hypothetical protein
MDQVTFYKHIKRLTKNTITLRAYASILEELVRRTSFIYNCIESHNSYYNYKLCRIITSTGAIAEENINPMEGKHYCTRCLLEYPTTPTIAILKLTIAWCWNFPECNLQFTENTTFYVRAYPLQTAMVQLMVMFVSCSKQLISGSVTDVDGNIYNTIDIGPKLVKDNLNHKIK